MTPEKIDIRKLFVRDNVMRILEDCKDYALLESTLFSQVNLTLRPPASPSEIREALATLSTKGRIEFFCDEDDPNLKKWKRRKPASE